VARGLSHCCAATLRARYLAAYSSFRDVRPATVQGPPIHTRDHGEYHGLRGSDRGSWRAGWASTMARAWSRSSRGR